jgi:hypothetical protein
MTDQAEQEECMKAVTKFLSSIPMSEANRNSKEKFSILVLNVIKSFPQILGDPRLYNQIQTALSLYTKE